MKQVKLTES